MKIIFVNSNPLPAPDPPSLQIFQTAVAMAKKKIDLHLLICRGSKTPINVYYNMQIPNKLHVHSLPGFKIYRGPFRFSWNFPFFFMILFKIFWLTWFKDIDAILVRNLKLGKFILRWRKFYRKMPVIVFETHEIFTLSYKDEMKRLGKIDKTKMNRLLKRERYVYEHADGLICITRNLAKMIQKEFNLNRPFTVASDGVNLSGFQKNIVCKSFNKSFSPENTILYMGSLHHWKGVDVLLKSLKHLPETNLLIVGGNHNSIDVLKNLAEELKISSRVYFEGFVSPGTRFKYFDYVRICILPLKPINIASFFTSPLKMFEYMASGKPIVASDLPSLREVLIDNINSVLVEPDNPEALADGIRMLLNDPLLGRRLCKQAEKDVLNYTWDKRADNITDFIKSVIFTQKMKLKSDF